MAEAAFARAPAGAPTDGWFHRNRRALAPWLFLAPGVLFFLFYVIFPIFQSFNISLYKWDGLGEARYIGLQNYYKLLGDRAFETSLWNNLKWLVLYLLAVPAGLFIAIFLSQTVAGIRLYKSLFFFPFVISQVVVGLVFTWFYDPTFGLLNTIVGWFGAGPINVLGDPALVTYGIIAAGLWPQTAYCMILYLTGLNAVDPEQVEAGRLDGARGWRMLWHVILPQLRPATLALDRIVRRAAAGQGLPVLDLPSGLRVRDTPTHRFWINHAPDSLTCNGRTAPPAGVLWEPVDGTQGTG